MHHLGFLSFSVSLSVIMPSSSSSFSVPSPGDIPSGRTLNANKKKHKKQKSTGECDAI
jgi:hypothetical protein